MLQNYIHFFFPRFKFMHLTLFVFALCSIIKLQHGQAKSQISCACIFFKIIYVHLCELPRSVLGPQKHRDSECGTSGKEVLHRRFRLNHASLQGYYFLIMTNALFWNFRIGLNLVKLLISEVLKGDSTPVALRQTGFQRVSILGEKKGLASTKRVSG